MNNESKGFRFNWGWGIFTLFFSFVGFMIFMVYMTTTVDHDLVTSDYYKQEIEFQKKIDMKTNLAKTGQHVSVTENGKEILVSVPAINEKSIETAEVYFYRPSDESKDLKLEKHHNGQFIVPADQLTKGEYIIKTEWTVEGIPYYEEINFTKS